MVQIWFTGKQRFRMELFPVLPGQRHLRPLHSVYSSKSREWAVRHQRSEKRQRDRTAVFWMDPSGSYPRKDGSRPDSVWPSADGRFPLDPGGLACVHIAEIPEALGMEIFKTVIILCIGPPVCHIIAVGIDVDIGWPDKRDSTSASTCPYLYRKALVADLERFLRVRRKTPIHRWPPPAVACKAPSHCLLNTGLPLQPALYPVHSSDCHCRKQQCGSLKFLHSP